ncbi:MULTISPECIES: phage major capsid protein [unclassified Aureimonas]|uniref:phage major capsid protein n=1 Tax=unclassified Aureimonas TaxID=2615206 RepID=UPI000B15138A|nr:MULTISPECIES: phage major capsid protein [unclassified Aureimonas]
MAALSSDVRAQLVALTISKYKRKFYDNILGSNMLLATLDKKGRVTSVDGGNDIRGQIIMDTELFAWYEGTDPLTRAQKKTIGDAAYSPAQAAASITLTGEETAKNNGEAAIKKLMRGKVMNAENTLKTKINDALYRDGSVPKSFVGLDAIVAADPTTGTVGGVNAAANVWWRNKTLTVTLTGAANADERYRRLKQGMNTLYRKTSNGTEKPDIITLDDETFGTFEDGLQENQRYTDAGAAKLGFEAYRFKGASVVSESDGSAHPTNGGFMLNTDYLNLEYYEGRGFEPLDLPESTPDLDAVTKHIAFMGALTCYNRSRQARLVVVR